MPWSKLSKISEVYILQSKVIAYVPATVVKEILIQPDIDGRRSRWIAKILEFDLEIKPTKLVKGQGLSKLLAESNCKNLGVNFINACSENQQGEVVNEDPQSGPSLAGCTWYEDVIFFLQELRPPDGMARSKARDLKLKEIKYCLIDQVLYWKDPIGVLLRCLDPQEAQRIIFHFHDKPMWGTPLLEDHSLQNSQGWVLLAHFIH
jgi:hypothetical protein